MRIALLALMCSSLMACSSESSDNDATNGAVSDDACGYDEYAQILAGAEADRVVPDTQTGTLEDVLVGVWQHTWSYDPGLPGDAWTDVSDGDTNIRFAIPSTDKFIYCQKAGVDGVNESSLSIDGTKLNVQGAGYTATAWTQDTMVWNNDFFEDREAFFVLRRLK